MISLVKRINYTLFLFQFITTLTIIFIHAPLPHYGYLFDSLGRATVIFYFIVSAYFYYFTINKEDYTYKVTIKKCLRLFIIASCSYIVYAIIMIFIKSHELGKYPSFFTNPSFDNIGELFSTYIRNIFFLWFVFALIVCYLLMPLINKWKFIHSKYAIIIPIVMLLGAYIFRIIATHYQFPDPFGRYESTRNFFFTGLPCFVLAFYLKEHVLDQNKLSNIKTPIFIILVILLVATTLLEAFLHDYFFHFCNEFYVSSVLLSVLLFIYGAYHPENKAGQLIEKAFSFRVMTIYYLTHVIILVAFSFMCTKPWLEYIRILVVISICLLLSVIYNLLRKLKKNRQNAS